MKFEYYNTGPKGLLAAASGERGSWRWRFVANNGETVASGEAYVNKADCLRAIALLKSTHALTPVVETNS
jgi:uncharacterized protein